MTAVRAGSHTGAVDENEIDLAQVAELVRSSADRGGARLSMFLPLTRGHATSNAQIRGRRLLRRAGQALRHDGMAQAQAAAAIGAAEAALDSLRPRRPAAAGLAMFVTAQTVRLFQVSVRLPELAVVGHRFTVGPLLPLLSVDGIFFVLGLDQQEIRLFRGTRRVIEEVELDGHRLAAYQTMPMPPPAQVHAYVADRGGVGKRVVFHGVGGNAMDDRKPRIRRHFRGVDQALREVLNEGQAPLVLAAVRHMQALYGEVNSYPHLLGEGIDGSPRDLSAEFLHRRAWPLVEPVLRRAEAAAIETYSELRGTGRTVAGPVDTLSAAEQGRVRSLLLCAKACTWRDFPNDGGIGRLSGSPRVEEQLERAAVATMRHAGRVFVVPARRMPPDLLAAATLRY